ncbi:MAG: hypothetical protein HN348_32375, partial [Proteobacteria bacterium]|nr:hypothetical protein [Pseudomonadota bacterium]
DCQQGCDSSEIEGCDGQCYPWWWLGDGICDWGLNCAQFNFDEGDCEHTGIHTGTIHTGPVVHTGAIHTGPVHTGLMHTGQVDTDDSSNIMYDTYDTADTADTALAMAPGHCVEESPSSKEIKEFPRFGMQFTK